MKDSSLLKIAGSCTIICRLDGASPRSPREDAEASSRRLNCRNDPLGYASRPELMQLLRYWRADRNVGGFRLTTVAATEHQTVPAP